MANAEKPDGWIVTGTILKNESPMLFLAAEPDVERLVRGFAENLYEGRNTHTVKAFRFIS